MRPDNRAALYCLLAACCAAACGRDDAEPVDHAVAEIEAPAITGDVDTIYTAAPAPDALPAGRIYYNLTDHEWYARGAPLVHENVGYAPAGNPVAAGVQEMQQVGDYFGVEYYVRPADTTAVLYVPVFEGYWLPFRPDTVRRTR
jgi:hypothetical protein